MLFGLPKRIKTVLQIYSQWQILSTAKNSHLLMPTKLGNLVPNQNLEAFTLNTKSPQNLNKLNKTQLIKKLNDLEWEDFEVKEAKANVPKNSWETVSAFSNTSGGWQVFGVKQIGKRFDIQGLTNPEKIEQDFLNGLRGDKFNVHISTQQQKYNIDGKVILAFYIPASAKKPVYYNNQINTFIRRGSADHRATKEEIDTMYRDQTFGTKTSEIAPNTGIKDLKTNSLSQYRDYMSRFNPGVSYNQLNENDFLTKLRIIENNACTYSGLLMFGNRSTIEKHFPDFWVDLLEIPGTSYSDAKTRYTFRLDEFDNLWEYYFECFARLKQKVDVKFIITGEGFGKELSPGIVAIREALVNMLMHADYFSPAHSRIRIFTDHIEFYNAGGLPKPYEELKGKDISLPRNPILTKLFRMVKLAENAGFGFDKIENNWMEYNKTKPVYDLSFDSTIVKFSMEHVEKTTVNSSEKILKDLQIHYEININDLQSKFNKRTLLILSAIMNNPSATQQKIATDLDVSVITIIRDMDKLRKAGLITREGAKKIGDWVILKQNKD